MFSLDVVMIAFEFGYNAHEKGDNIQKAKLNFLKLIKETIKR